MILCVTFAMTLLQCSSTWIRLKNRLMRASKSVSHIWEIKQLPSPVFIAIFIFPTNLEVMEMQPWCVWETFPEGTNKSSSFPMTIYQMVNFSANSPLICFKLLVCKWKSFVSLIKSWSVKINEISAWSLRNVWQRTSVLLWFDENSCGFAWSLNVELTCSSLFLWVSTHYQKTCEILRSCWLNVAARLASHCASGPTINFDLTI